MTDTGCEPNGCTSRGTTACRLFWRSMRATPSRSTPGTPAGTQVTRTSTSADAANRKRRAGVGHALTGPIAVHGARPGDTLVVEVREVTPAQWGWTSFSARSGAAARRFPRDLSAHLGPVRWLHRAWTRGRPGAAGAILRCDGRGAGRTGQAQHRFRPAASAATWMSAS